MIILVDQDEVLADFITPLIARWRSHTGREVTREDIRSWDLRPVFDEPGWVRKVIEEPDYFPSLEPKEGAIEGFRQLASDGHDLIIVTHVSDEVRNAMEGKREWCRRHIPEFPLKNLSFFTRKELIEGDALIDDGPHNIQGWLDRRRKNPILFDAPWNRDAHFVTPCFNVLFRAKNWPQIVERIRGVVGDDGWFHTMGSI